MIAKCSMCHGSGIVTSQTICDCKKLLESPPRDWKPVVGEKVLVVDEATFDRMEDDTIAVVRWVHSGGYSQVPLYNIRPLRKEGE